MVSKAQMSRWSPGHSKEVHLSSLGRWVHMVLRGLSLLHASLPLAPKSLLL